MRIVTQMVIIGMAVANPKDCFQLTMLKDMQPAKAKFELTRYTSRNTVIQFRPQNGKLILSSSDNNARKNSSLEILSANQVFTTTLLRDRGNENDVIYVGMVAKFR